jgi:hypothetical protein
MGGVVSGTYTSTCARSSGETSTSSFNNGAPRYICLLILSGKLHGARRARRFGDSEDDI